MEKLWTTQKNAEKMNHFMFDKHHLSLPARKLTKSYAALPLAPKNAHTPVQMRKSIYDGRESQVLIDTPLYAVDPVCHRNTSNVQTFPTNFPS
jgi:hypothetical protein